MKLRVTLEAETSLIPDLQDCKTVQEVRAVLFTQAEESPIKGLKLVGVDLADKSAQAETGEPDCSKCKWVDGKDTMTGIGSEWPCESCMTNRFEPQEG